MEASVEWEEISVAMLITKVDYSSEKVVILNFNDPLVCESGAFVRGKIYQTVSELFTIDAKPLDFIMVPF